MADHDARRPGRVNLTTTSFRGFRVLALVFVLLLAGADAASAQSLSATSAKPLKLASSYVGTATNEIPGGGTSTLTLTAVKQTRLNSTSATVTGTLKVGSGSRVTQTSKFVGYENGKTLTLTIARWTGSTCLKGGCKIVYLATIGANARLTGYYSYYNTTGGVDGSQGGVWAVKSA